MRSPIAIIGAGGAGLVTAQALVEAGIEPVLFEARDGLGGNWRYDPRPGRSSCYASLTTNTSRFRTTLRTHRLGARGPLHLPHAEMLDYLEEYARRFGLHERMHTDTEVVRVARNDDGTWLVHTRAGNVSTHGAVVIATGYNSVPLMPSWPGDLDGPVLHTHDYRVPEPFADRDVVVVGMGSSSTELACEISGVARSVTIIARSGRDVVPKRIGPIPTDAFDTQANARLPWSMRRRLIALTARLTIGDLTRYGAPPPPARCGDAPIAVSQSLRDAVRSGRVRLTSGAIARLEADTVELVDGRRLPATALLAGTGYKMSFPFLPPDADPPTMERVPLYRGVASLALPGLYYVGMLAAHGALLPMFEAQAEWLAAVISGRLELPPPESMRAAVDADRRVLERDFDPRHAILYDRLPYVRALRREAAVGGRAPHAAAATLR